MRNLIIIVTVFLGLTVHGQEAVKKSKNCKTVISVKGNCKMCKARIEKSALKTKGVKYAVWGVQSKELQLIYNETKTSKEAIVKSILAVGHDVDSLKVKDEIYNSLHHCCQYRNE
jgi:cation transport ATPase